MATHAKQNERECPSTESNQDFLDSGSSEEPFSSSSQERESNIEARHWSDVNNRSNPMNWTKFQRWSIITAISYIEFLTHLASLMFAPSLPQVQYEFHDVDGVLTAMSMTIYVLGFAAGPVLIAPLSELYGRARAYRITTLFYLILTVACALSINLNMLIAFRFFAGCFGAAPVAIGGAIVSDMFPQAQRGKAMAVYQLGPILGPLLGPIMGGYISQSKGWRWIFWVVTILAGLAAVISFLIVRETHHPTILRRELKAQVGYEENSLSTVADEATQRGNPSKAILRAISRPILMLTQSPVVFLSCLITPLIFGTMNIVFSTLGLLFQTLYDFNTGESGLVYLGMALGSVIGAFVSGRTNDRIVERLADRHDKIVHPEYRTPPIAIGALFIATGLFCYGWTAEYAIFWLAPILGLAVLGFGLTTVHLASQTYLIDAFTFHAASVLAASTMTRSLGGALIPLTGQVLYRNLGLGWGNSLFAFLNLSLCPLAYILYQYGNRLRARFRFG